MTEEIVQHVKKFAGFTATADQQTSTIQSDHAVHDKCMEYSDP